MKDILIKKWDEFVSDLLESRTYTHELGKSTAILIKWLSYYGMKYKVNMNHDTNDFQLYLWNDNFIKSKNEQEQKFGNRLNDILKIEQKNLFVGTGIGILFSFFLIFGLLTLLLLELITSSNFKLTYIVGSLLISLYILYIFVYKIEYIQQKLNIELSEIEKTVKQFILDVQKDNEIPK